MYASFEIKAYSKIMATKYQRLYNTKDSEEQEMEEDLITTCAVVWILILILMNLIYKSIFNILKMIDLYLNNFFLKFNNHLIKLKLFCILINTFILFY